MAFPARLVFTDLCAYFRRSVEELAVVLVDARTATEEQREAGMHPHEPVLAVPVRNLSPDPENRVPDRLVPALDGDALAVFVLDREEIRLASPSPFDVATYRRTGSCPLSCVDERSFEWIASLNQLGFTRDGLAPAVLGDLHEGPVVSRIEVTGGRITCGRVIRADGEYRQFELRSNPEAPAVGEPQALGDLVEVELTMPTVDENAGPQILSSLGRSISILASPDGSKVELLVGNMSLDPGLLSAGNAVATHFRWFYELLQDPPPLFERTIPFAVPRGPLTSTGPQICPGVRFDV